MKLLFLDTETTGNELDKDRLCQVCYKDGGQFKTELFKPPVPITVKSMSITHITNEMVEDKQSFKDSEMRAELEDLLKTHVLVAHNAKFDIAMLESENLDVPNWICTLRLVRHLDDENKVPEYNLQFLRYFLDLKVDGTAHDAEGDVKVLDALFQRVYKKMQEQHKGKDFDEIIKLMQDISSRPSLIRIMPFGKYKDTPLSEIAQTDREYLSWLLNQKLENEKAEDEDWIYTLKHFLNLK